MESLLRSLKRRAKKTEKDVGKGQKRIKVLPGIGSSSSTGSHIGVIFENPVEKALDNYVILCRIFDFLPSEYVLKCRLVNHCWNQVGAANVMRRCDLKITLTYKPATSTYEHSIKDGSVPLTTFLSSITPQFPCSEYRIVNGNLSAPEMQDLFTKRGTTIKELHLDIFATEQATPEEYTPIQVFRHLLVSQVYTLRHLTLTHLPEPWALQDIKLFPTKVELKCLESIEFCWEASLQTQVVQDLVAAAVNLKVFKGFHPAYGSAFKTPEKRSTIRELFVHPTEEYLAHWEKLDFIPEIQAVAVQFHGVEGKDYQRAANCFIQILQHNLKTLKVVHGHDPVKIFGRIRIPVMEAVDTVVLDVSWLAWSQIASLSLANVPRYEYQWFQKLFPHLHCVELGFWILSEHNTDFFDCLDPIRSVKTLKFCATGGVFCLQSISKISYLFPNVVDLRIGSTSKYIEIMRQIWANFTLLENFEIEFYLNASHYASVNVSDKGKDILDGVYYPGLDSAITGIPASDLRLMSQTFSCRPISHKSVDATSAPISNMRRLQRFQITIRASPYLYIPQQCLFSSASFLHGFHILPHPVNITIRVPPREVREDLMSALSLMTHFATIIT